MQPSNMSSLAAPRTPSPNTLLPSLSHLNSSVPDLASTLTLHSSADPSDDAEIENLSFLRHPAAAAEEPPDPRAGYSSPGRGSAQEVTRRRQETLQTHERSLSEEAQEQRHLRDRHLRHNFDSHEAWAESLRSRVGVDSPRTAQLPDATRRELYASAPPRRQNLYDWAPASEEGDEHELEEILTELREQQPNTHPDILRVLGRNQMEARLSALEERTRRAANAVTGRGSSDESGITHQSSLRTAAILSSVRRNRQLSARSRDLMQRYVMDRERLDRERAHQDGSNEDRDRHSGNSSGMWFRMAQQANEQHSNRYELNRLAWQANQRSSSNVADAAANVESSNGHPRPSETLETLRRRYLEDPHPQIQEQPSSIEAFKSSIEFLKALAQFDEEDRSFTEIWKLVRRHSYTLAHLPTINPSAAGRLSQGLPPPPCSFLRAGMVFSGFQQAAPQLTTLTTGSSNAQSSSDTAPDPLALYRFLNNQGPPPGSIDPPTQANLAARAAWDRNGDGPRSQTTPQGPHPVGAQTGTSSSARARDNPAVSTTAPCQDRWAVRVHIHDVDYERMTLQGTMEAFNMPSGGTNNSTGPYPESAIRSTQRPTPPNRITSAAGPGGPGGIAPSTPPKTTTFSTYVTGELIDLSQHSLQTPSGAAYFATSADDAKYWKRLEPFASAVRSRGSTPAGGPRGSALKIEEDDDDDAALAARVLDPQWLDEAWQQQYVLMRWKERCFVRPTQGASGARDEGDGGLRNVSGEREIRNRDGTAARTPSFGLSIKGFYYVSLRRRDGRIEGLYFDPQSSPYQRLEMEVDRASGCGRGVAGTWEFV